MNENNFAIKFKRYAVLGMSLLGLAAIGCGGGNGTLRGVPQDCIGANRIANATQCTAAGFSLQKIRGVNKSYSDLGTSATLEVYAMDGTLLDTIQNFQLPSSLSISGDLFSKAEAQGGLVYRLTNGTVDYTTVSALDAASLNSNGPIQNADGTLKQEPVNAGSTVRTALLEAELSQQTGKAVRLGTKASADVKAALEAAVTEVAVDQIAGALKDAEFTDGSLIQSIASTVKSSGSTGAINTQDAIRQYLSTGKDANGNNSASAAVKTQLKQARRLAKAATRLSKQAKKNAGANKAKVKTLLADLTSSTAAQANDKSAGAEVINAALDLATKATSLGTAADGLLALTDLTQAVAQAETTFLNQIDDQVALELASKGAVSEVANLLGNVVAQTSNLSTTAQAALNKVQSNLSTSDQNKLAGGLLAATVDNVEAAKTVIANAGVSVTEALKAVANEVNVADVVGIVEDVINTSEGLTTLTTNDLVSSLREVVDGDVLSAIAAEVDFVIADAACISGLSCGDDADASRTDTLTVKTGDVLSLANASVEGSDTATYTYSWTIPSSLGTGAAISTDNEQASLTVTSSGNVVLEQSRDGVKVSTFTLVVSAQQTLDPVVELSAAELRIKPGQTAQLTANVYDPEGRTLITEVSVKTYAGDAATGLSIVKSGNVITLSATSAVAPQAAPYKGSLEVKANNYVLATAEFDVYVDNYAATKLTVSGVTDVTTGTTSLITLTAYSENPAASGTMTLTVLNVDGEQDILVDTVSASLAAGTATTSLSITTDQAGLFMVTASATGSDPQTLVYNVKEVGAPTFDSVKFNGLTVVQGDYKEFVIAAGASLTVDIDASASVEDGNITTYLVQVELGDAESSFGSQNGTDMSTSIGAGEWLFGVMATSDSGAVAMRIFQIKVTEVRELEVTGVALSGASTNTLSTSFEGGQYKVDASAVQGLSLSNQGLSFTVDAVGNNSGINASDYTIAVKLMTPASDLREASITVEGATIATVGSDYDVTGASVITFKGKKSDGIQEAVYSAPSSAINNFDSLFLASSSTDGITIDINALLQAVKEDVISSTGTFYQSIDTLTGTGLKLEVTVSADNFSFKYGTKKFNTFLIENITVE